MALCALEYRQLLLMFFASNVQMESRSGLDSHVSYVELLQLGKMGCVLFVLMAVLRVPVTPSVSHAQPGTLG